MRLDMMLGTHSRAVAVHPVRLRDLPDLLRLRAAQLGRDAGERLVYGGGRADELELREALFDTPARAWAWLARLDDRPIGYACATAGFSLPERAYYLRLEDLFVSEAQHDAELALVRKVAAAAGEMGCANLQWRFAADDPLAARIAMYTGATRLDVVPYVLPVMADGMGD